MIKMKAFILESKKETIAVIKLTDKDEFYRTVRLAIAEHYICEHNEVSIVMNEEQYNQEIYLQTLEIESVEQGNDCIRNYTLTETCVY
jgi:hypothetical protein|tara:strand:+ start:318 stop:581 length:264 start_codon:yes stop_codon:yes gene_type:complete